MEKILFVCLGNICRSPMAEAVMRNKIQEIGLEKELLTASAATSSWEAGNRPHIGTQKLLKQNGITFDGIRSTKIQPEDFYNYGYIIGMDENNLEDLRRMAPTNWDGELHLFMSVVEGQETEEVPDPYYTGDFQMTYKMIDSGTDAWLNLIKNNRNK
ncbi:low molecular weight phosphotyrosine protein phosphatase [Enterococcus sp. BWB1-3]|uniref:low molecular weight protein-tyrosine-phosphatase n=1 Tax=unclassified Enterococcus TaxID=2608891 RepID=UPI0019215495|nr:MULTISPECIES: low molecular weight protein-tyrosine-phosphatase [unclassified Enterococcus]MBL1229885.1 low molecular weight phosphotyrosine protein phosphatase [Enterococcus sp. BWB1-3]MCB5951401.1 low molecular weight phosphotyrosine protein phosphatase [Enterococcus sp. BWT-B8]MCB5954960.1 low molecular weight phosphotyrosine protein phosphatase [Enterococcus sp. CWB-B31]